MLPFIPLFIQKRILRFALSQLGLLDTDAFDIEKLEFSWGRKSTLELRDVSIQRERLATLLHLPGHVQITKATLGLLRLHVPVDLRVTGLIIEVSQVQISVAVELQDPNGKPANRDQPPDVRAPHALESDSKLGSNNQSYMHDPGGSPTSRQADSPSQRDNDGSGYIPHLPSPADLAKSYLNDESGEEKDQLQSALRQSQVLRRSSAEDGSDQQEDLGVGDQISLPSFLATFLEGIVERIEFKASALSLDISISPDLPNKAAESPFLRPNATISNVFLEVHELRSFNGIPESPLPPQYSYARRTLQVDEVRISGLLEPHGSAPGTSLEAAKTSAELRDSGPRTQTVSSEDLTESKIFTHEEASSMYLSALGDLDMGPPKASSETNTAEHFQDPSIVSMGSSNAKDCAFSKQMPKDIPGARDRKSPSELDTTKRDAPVGQYRNNRPSSSKELLTIGSMRIEVPSFSNLSLSSHRIPPPSDSDLDEKIPNNGADTSKSLPALYLQDVSIDAESEILEAVAMLTGYLQAMPFDPYPDRQEHRDAAPTPSLTMGLHGLSCKIRGKALEPTVSLAPEIPESLLECSVKSISIDCTAAMAESKIAVSLKDFVLKDAGGVIMHFETQDGLKQSSGNLSLSPGDDLALLLRLSTSATSLDLAAGKAIFEVDIAQSEERISRFTNMSRIAALGGSMCSSYRVQMRESPQHQVKKGTRAVRFASTQHDADSTGTKLKANARIDGVSLVMHGNHSILRFQTSPLKLVNRTEGLGLQIDRLHLKAAPAIEDKEWLNLIMVNNRVEFLTESKNEDIDRLLSLIQPPNMKEDEFSGKILTDTLENQRRQGAVIRLSSHKVSFDLVDQNQLTFLWTTFDELNQLSSVAQFLPRTDRIGTLVLSSFREIVFHCRYEEPFGSCRLTLSKVAAACVTCPVLFALGTEAVTMDGCGQQDLVGVGLPSCPPPSSATPVILVRYLHDSLSPTADISIHDMRIEYFAWMFNPDASKASDNSCLSQPALDNEAVQKPRIPPTPQDSEHGLKAESRRTDSSLLRSLGVQLNLQNILMGLNSVGTSGTGYLIVYDAVVTSELHDTGLQISLSLEKSSLFVLDEIDKIHPPASVSTSYEEVLRCRAYISMGNLLSVKAIAKTSRQAEGPLGVHVEFSTGFLLLETCADSTQTLFEILGNLKPASTGSETDLNYRTQMMTMDDMVATFNGDAFNRDDDIKLGEASDEEGSARNRRNSGRRDRGLVTNFFNTDIAQQNSRLKSAVKAHDDDWDELHEDDLNGSSPSLAAAGASDLDFQDEYFATERSQMRVEASLGIFERSAQPRISQHTLSVANLHVIWNIYDGFDWKSTRTVLDQAVANVQQRATEEHQRKGSNQPADQPADDNFIDDFLFNSMYIGVPQNSDPKRLIRDINQTIGSTSNEANSHPPQMDVLSDNMSQRSSSEHTKLRLGRSQHHKMTFELKGVSACVSILPSRPTGLQNRLTLEVEDIEIFDHIASSTWRKFLTYMHDAGERETGRPMIRAEINTLKPVVDLEALELSAQVSILPLRLHVDQDTLDFMSRFFEFRRPPDASLMAEERPSNQPFFQRLEICAVRVKLDFKPKRVDIAGIRSGHTSEFMNLFALDQADMVLRRVILYGVNGFGRLSKTLNDIWMPDIKRNQLPGVLAGLAPLRSFANLGGGIKDLVIIPIREYKKDGRMIRSLQKGAVTFARTTTSEFVKLGAKLAIGTQTILEGAEALLTQPRRASAVEGKWEEVGIDEDEKKRISHYADQPLGVIQGLRGAYDGIERDLLTAKDAVIAMPAVVMSSDNAGEAARALLKTAPTIVLRPALGVTKAVGQTFLGAANSLDPNHRRRIEDKYKKY